MLVEATGRLGMLGYTRVLHPVEQREPIGNKVQNNEEQADAWARLLTAVPGETSSHFGRSGVGTSFRDGEAHRRAGHVRGNATCVRWKSTSPTVIRG